MGFMRDVEILWDDLLEAFENMDAEMVYFLDRETGEIFMVPADYEDEGFWEEIEDSSDRYIQIPGYDYEQERILIYEFIKGLENEHLKSILDRAFAGKTPYGRVDEILSFYPEEFDRYMAIREGALSERVRRWLEEHDMFAPEKDF